MDKELGGYSEISSSHPVSPVSGPHIKPISEGKASSSSIYTCAISSDGAMLVMQFGAMLEVCEIDGTIETEGKGVISLSIYASLLFSTLGHLMNGTF